MGVRDRATAAPPNAVPVFGQFSTIHWHSPLTNNLPSAVSFSVCAVASAAPVVSAAPDATLPRRYFVSYLYTHYLYPPLVYILDRVHTYNSSCFPEVDPEQGGVIEQIYGSPQPNLVITFSYTAIPFHLLARDEFEMGIKC